MRVEPIASLSQRHHYYPHIDGLRALAVISVLLYHLGFGFIPGGFAGVDVFFVISGYLITSHIRQSLLDKRFSFARFYARRVRRLLPALLVTLLATLVAGYFVLPTANYERLGQEALFALFSAANVLFWSQSGYFDSAATLKPLLHTWSLSVEEQFYLIWPLLLVLLSGTRRTVLTLAGLALASLIAAQCLLASEPALVFFMMPFRIAEFALGAGLVWCRPLRRPDGLAAEWLSLTGLGLVLASTLVLTKSSLFPGLAAMPVCLGTALLIHSAERTQVGRLLCLKPVIYIGMISYSLYLVHWPLIVFYQYLVLSEPGIVAQFGLLATSIALAILMYHLVETPFRRSRGRFAMSGKTAAGAMLSLAVVLVAGGSHILLKDGWPWRFDYPQLSADEIEAGKNARFDLIQVICVERGWERCQEPSQQRGRNIAVLGDSHGIDGLNILHQAFPDYHITSISQGGCPPLIPEDMDIMGPTWPDREECVALNQQRLSPDFLNDHAAIVFSVQFDWYTAEHLRNAVDHIRAFSDIPILVLGNFVFLEQPMVDLHNQQVDPRGRPATVKSFAAFEEKLTEQAAGSYTFISKRDLFCAGVQLDSCRLYFDGVPFAYDKSHLSLEATAFAAKRLRERHADGFAGLIKRTP